MSSQGPNSPASATDNSGTGTVAWTNPGNATAADNTYAVASPGVISDTHYLWCINFGFSIPAGATINGILVEVRACGMQFSTIGAAKLIKGGAVTGNAKTASPSWPACPAGAGVYTGQLGSSSDLWGATLAAADVNASNFGVAVSFHCTSPQGDTVSADHIRITVTYTGGGSPASGSLLLMGV